MFGGGRYPLSQGNCCIAKTAVKVLVGEPGTEMADLEGTLGVGVIRQGCQVKAIYALVQFS